MLMPGGQPDGGGLDAAGIDWCITAIKGPISLNKIGTENGGGWIVYVALWKLQYTTWLFGDL